MKSDRRFSSPVKSVLNRTLSSQDRSEKGLIGRHYRSANPSRRSSAVSYDIGTIHEGCPVQDFSSRRMSAPELPPILDSRILTSNQTMGNGNEYYKTRSNHMSNNSDSSQKGLRIRRSPHSATSSSSGTRNHSANVHGRTKHWTTVPEQTITASPEALKLDSIKNKNGVSVQTPRGSMNGYRTNRLPSRDKSTSSGNNNTRQGKNKFCHCASEPKIQPIEQFMGSKGNKPQMRRNASDNKLVNKSRLISIEKTQNLTQGKYNSSNVNGMRRYSSTVQLNNCVRNKNENDDYEDDDTDSDSGKDQMIIEWLIGVENEEPEAPPDPLIDYAETPVQTDTAIHIVYSES